MSNYTGKLTTANLKGVLSSPQIKGSLSNNTLKGILTIATLQGKLSTPILKAIISGQSRYYGVNIVDSATYTLLKTDFILSVEYTTTGSVTITIPTSQTIVGRVIVIKDAGNNAVTNFITISTEGNEKIEFSTSDYIMSSSGERLIIYCDGTDWFIIN